MEAPIRDFRSAQIRARGQPVNRSAQSPAFELVLQIVFNGCGRTYDRDAVVSAAKGSRQE